MLRLYYHPFASFCQKALIALYENGTAFTGEIIDLGDPEQRAALEAVWPMTKFPVLRDEARNVTVPESSLVIEYLGNNYPGAVKLVPDDPDTALRVHLLDRLFDNYISLPMQKIVVDTFRPAGRGDPDGVEEARALMTRTYAILDKELAHVGWAGGDGFSLADCAAAPALFYSNTVVPFAGYPHLAAYYERLLGRPSFARVVEEARPYRHLFPLPWPAGYD
jgi:glutathione S-transferase